MKGKTSVNGWQASGDFASNMMMLDHTLQKSKTPITTGGPETPSSPIRRLPLLQIWSSEPEFMSRSREDSIRAA